MLRRDDDDIAARSGQSCTRSVETAQAVFVISLDQNCPIFRRAAADRDSIRGLWCLYRRREKDQAVFSIACGTKAASFAIDAAAIDESRGLCPHRSAEKDQAILDKFCAQN